jgi:hypothetical protein
MEEKILAMLPKERLERWVVNACPVVDQEAVAYNKAIREFSALVPAIIEKVYEELRGNVGEAHNVDTNYTGAACGVTDCAVFWDGCCHTCQFCGKEYVMKDRVLSLLSAKSGSAIEWRRNAVTGKPQAIKVFNE